MIWWSVALIRILLDIFDIKACTLLNTLSFCVLLVVDNLMHINGFISTFIRINEVYYCYYNIIIIIITKLYLCMSIDYSKLNGTKLQ
jgi:hypothetical protein